jgi:hypothetical protein
VRACSSATALIEWFAWGEPSQREALRAAAGDLGPTTRAIARRYLDDL